MSATQTLVWNPFTAREKDPRPPTREALKRIKSDIRKLVRSPLPGVVVWVDEKDITLVHALVNGPFETPYEGGFFYFLIWCPADYPMEPPKCMLMTTGGGTVRFNPNLYANGKVCLSILGTWSGPGWSPAQSLGTVLLSIQSLMNENPYHNEPGFEVARRAGDVKAYNEIIRHETIRVAVLEVVGDTATHASLPPPFQQLVREMYPTFASSYEEVCRSKAGKSGLAMEDPFGEKRGTFRWNTMLEEVRTLQAKLAPGAGEEKSCEVAIKGKTKGKHGDAKPVPTREAVALAPAGGAEAAPEGVPDGGDGTPKSTLAAAVAAAAGGPEEEEEETDEQ